MPPSNPLPTSMLAWQHHPGYLSFSSFTTKLRLNQVAAAPSLTSPNQTLVKVLSAGINPVDYKLGELPLIARLTFGSPSTPGIDFVGRVWATNLPTQSQFKAGDLVFGKIEPVAGPFGTLAQFTVVTGIDAIVKVPDGVELDELAGVGVAGLTAFQSLVPYLEKDGEGSARGKSVFINGGSGGVGCFAVQIAKAIGCEEVVVSCSAANADLVRSLGATEVVDYRSVNVPDALGAWVKGKKDRKFDHVVDNVGADMNIYWRAHEYLADAASYVFVGAGVSMKATKDLTLAMTLPGFLGGGKRKFAFLLTKANGAQFERMGKLMKEGKVKCIIDSTFTMDEVNKAYERLKTGRSRGKVIVRVSEDGRGPGY